jgi:hypothetical protein
MLTLFTGLIVCITAAYASVLNTTHDHPLVVEFQDVSRHRDNYPQGVVVAHSIYFRSQDSIHYYIPQPSDVFTKIPGLMFAIHHKHPTVYQLHFQGSCLLSSAYIHGFVRFLIDGRVLVSNYLLPNNDQRHLRAPELGADLNQFDYRAGGMIYSGGSPGIAMSCPKSDLIYMPAGTHIVEFAARTRYHGGITVWGGEISVQLTQYDSKMNLGLSHPVIR